MISLPYAWAPKSIYTEKAIWTVCSISSWSRLCNDYTYFVLMSSMCDDRVCCTTEALKYAQTAYFVSWYSDLKDKELPIVQQRVRIFFVGLWCNFVAECLKALEFLHTEISASLSTWLFHLWGVRKLVLPKLGWEPSVMEIDYSQLVIGKVF